MLHHPHNQTRAPTRIGEQLQIANGIITNLIDLIRERPLAREPVRLAAVLAQAADTLGSDQARLTLEGLDGLPEVSGDAAKLRQAFVNLIQNAAQASGPEGRVWVRGATREGGVEVVVEDSGPGVDPETRRRLFEPLITTKDQGVGLGLALVKRIVEHHQGMVTYRERSGGGACFTVRLPR